VGCPQKRVEPEGVGRLCDEQWTTDATTCHTRIEPLGPLLAVRGSMNHNCLIIAADGSTARLFRIAETNDRARPVELIEVGAVTALGADDVVSADATSALSSSMAATLQLRRESGTPEALELLARRVAERAAAFGEHHYCNPVFVVASRALWPAISEEVDRRLPNVHVRPIYGEVAGLAPQQILERLQQHEGFA